MINDIVSEKILSFKYITANTIYGNSPDFIETVDQIENVIYFVSVPSTTQCWLKSPTTKEIEIGPNNILYFLIYLEYSSQENSFDF